MWVQYLPDYLYSHEWTTSSCVMLKHTDFSSVADPKLLFADPTWSVISDSDPDPDPDPALGSFRIRIQILDWN